MLTPTSQWFKTREVIIRCAQRRMLATLSIPSGAQAVVAFAHGSGSGRFSARNQFVASVLQKAGLATLLLDLLEDEEAEVQQNVFDIELLASRLNDAANWLRDDVDTRGMTLGFFGASTGGAAALLAESQNPKRVGAIVSRGGRPDLAGNALEQVSAPTLLIVGGNDGAVVELNERAFQRLRCPKEIVVVPGATHLFPEPGTLEEVARLARNWFSRYLLSESNEEVNP